jgi:hypothetical protein
LAEDGVFFLERVDLWKDRLGVGCEERRVDGWKEELNLSKRRKGRLGHNKINIMIHTNLSSSCHPFILSHSLNH